MAVGLRLLGIEPVEEM
ncbi:MAG: hypothetical protein ACREID_04735 [Planctomycetota bacterium]